MSWSINHRQANQSGHTSGNLQEFIVRQDIQDSSLLNLSTIFCLSIWAAINNRNQKQIKSPKFAKPFHLPKPIIRTRLLEWTSTTCSCTLAFVARLMVVHAIFFCGTFFSIAHSGLTYDFICVFCDTRQWLKSSHSSTNPANCPEPSLTSDAPSYAAAAPLHLSVQLTITTHSVL